MVEMELDERKAVAFDILKYIDKVCRDNNIKYFLYAGTLIGAIRHKGFIPWDDDIDIALLRDDYERLITILKEDDRFNLLYPGLERYYYQFAKLCDPRTYAKEIGLPYVEGLGTWVDIFPIDKVPDDYNDRCAFFKECVDMGLKLRACIPGVYYISTSELKSKIKKILFFPKVLPYRLKGLMYWENKLISLNQKYNNSDYTYVGILPTPYGEKCSHPRSDFDETMECEFEGHSFLIPKNYDSVLKKIYGDYMQLPPEEKRVLPHTCNVYWKSQM